MYRTRWTPEDADDGCMSVVPTADPRPWAEPCGVCGQWEGNTLEWDHCIVCNHPRGSWLCDCGHLNPRRASDCETCGRPRTKNAA